MGSGASWFMHVTLTKPLASIKPQLTNTTLFATPEERAELFIGGYCTVKTSDYLTEEMSLAEIEEISQASKAGNINQKAHGSLPGLEDGQKRQP